MKKLLCTVTVLVACFDTMGMLIRFGDGRFDNTQIATTVGVTDTMAVRSSDGEVTRDVRETLRYDRILELVGNQTRLSFVKGTESAGVFVRGDETVEKSYPYIKDFLEIVPSDASHSFAVYKLFAETEELGRIQLSARHVDSEHPLAHQTKTTFSSTKKSTQTFVLVDGQERLVKSQEEDIPLQTEAAIVKYHSDLMETQQFGQPTYKTIPSTLRDYVRGNGETFSRDWQNLCLILKLPPAPPVNIFSTDYLWIYPYTSLRKALVKMNQMGAKFSETELLNRNKNILIKASFRK